MIEISSVLFIRLGHLLRAERKNCSLIIFIECRIKKTIIISEPA